MKRTALLLIVLLATTAAPTHARAAARIPRVLRDAEAGRDELPADQTVQEDTTVEPSIAVNSRDARNAVTVYQTGRNGGGCAQAIGYASTFDGGKTWLHGYLPGVAATAGSATPSASDPVAAFGPGDVVYANSLVCAETMGLAVHVSRNGGRTWDAPIRVPVERTPPLADKNWIVVDKGRGPGHHLGRLYLVFDSTAPVVAMYSDDQARTWQGPFVVYAGQGAGAIPVVMPKGDLAVVFEAAYPLPRLGPVDPNDAAGYEKIVSVVAAGAGGTPTGGPLLFTLPTTVATFRGNAARDERASDALPTADVDPKTGRIYVAWEDGRFRKDIVNDIVIVHSDDAGRTWSSVRRVNPGRNDDLVEHFTPAVAVGDDSIVRISYRRQQQTSNANDIPQHFVDTYYQQSRDGGMRFSAPMKVNRRVHTDIRFAATSGNAAFLGDYSQVAVHGSWAYVVRAEAYSVSRYEAAVFPPASHHQRMWVAVVDSDGDGKP